MGVDRQGIRMVANLTKGQRKRAEIVEIARNVLIEDGYDCFVLRDIAQRAGIKLGNLQYYFPTCDDLIEAVARAEDERTHQAIRAIDREGGTPLERLTRFVHTIVSQWQREGGKVFVVVTLLSIHNPRFRKLHLEIYEHFYEALCDVLSDFEPKTPRAKLMRKARLATSLLDGALSQVPIERGHGSKKMMSEFLAELTDATLLLVGQKK